MSFFNKKIILDFEITKELLSLSTLVYNLGLELNFMKDSSNNFDLQSIDISSLTGESLPLEATPGVELPSGSLNLESTITLEVQKIGSETAIAKIISLVEEAQARKAPIQGLADKVAGMFCYGVTTLALITIIVLNFVFVKSS